MSPWKPQAPRGWGLCTGTGHPPEICHGNGGFCTFCFQGPPPASRSSSELTTSTGVWQAHTLSTSQGWGLEDRNVSTRQISDKDVLRLIEALWPQVQKKKNTTAEALNMGTSSAPVRTGCHPSPNTALLLGSPFTVILGFHCSPPRAGDPASCTPQISVTAKLL